MQACCILHRSERKSRIDNSPSCFVQEGLFLHAALRVAAGAGTLVLAAGGIEAIAE